MHIIYHACYTLKCESPNVAYIKEYVNKTFQLSLEWYLKWLCKYFDINIPMLVIGLQI